MISSLNARFDGTYSLLLAAAAWNNPTAARTITVTICQYEQAGGTMISKTVSRTLTPSSEITNGVVNMGVVTLPDKALPPDNTAAYFTVTITDTNTSDDFSDLMFLDTMGSTVIINSSVAYGSFYFDEPARPDLGRILGSQFDRSDAVSVLDQILSISGPPLMVDPEGNQSLFVWSLDGGAPTAFCAYSPRWRVDRMR